MAEIVILGAGYTGSRVARLLEASGRPVAALRSADFDITRPATWQTLRAAVNGARVLHSIPVLRTPEGYLPTMPVLAPLLAEAARVVYLSTTGIYGDTTDVDETTAPAPRHQREQLRVEEEQAVLNGPWRSKQGALVLRPAAIYGPDRGIHVSMRAGTYRLVGDGSNYISRIHVDDLAEICAAGLLSDINGAFPVADLYPCPAREIAAWCAEHFGYPMLPSVDSLPADDTRRSNRRVDGRAIVRALGTTLRYPSYREGLAI